MPQWLASSLNGGAKARPGRSAIFREATGAESPIPRGERVISRKAIAQGMSDVLRCPVCSCAAFCTISHTRPRVQRASGIPCALSLEGKEKTAKLGRSAPREREIMTGRRCRRFDRRCPIRARSRSSAPSPRSGRAPWLPAPTRRRADARPRGGNSKPNLDADLGEEALKARELVCRTVLPGSEIWPDFVRNRAGAIAEMSHPCRNLRHLAY
jgi:hypothetical protein